MKRHLKLVCCLWFMVISTTLLFAQGKYLEKDQTGIGFRAGYGSTAEVSTINAGFGVAITEFIDLGLEYSRISTSSTIGNFYGCSLTLYPLEQSDKMPLSVSLYSSVLWGSYKSNYGEKLGISGSTFNVAGSIYRVLGKGHELSLMPEFIFGSGTANVWSDELSLHDSVTYLGLNVSLIINESKKNLFIITSGISWAEKNRTLEISINIVIPHVTD